MKLEALTNNDLWERYKAAMDDLCADPEDISRSRIVNRIESEIFRRMQEVSRKPLVRQEA